MTHRGKKQFGAPMFETEVFRKYMYCIEESTCDIVGTFRRPLSHSAFPHSFGAPAAIRRPHSDSAPGKLCALVTPLDATQGFEANISYCPRFGCGLINQALWHMNCWKILICSSLVKFLKYVDVQFVSNIFIFVIFFVMQGSGAVNNFVREEPVTWRSTDCSLHIFQTVEIIIKHQRKFSLIPAALLMQGHGIFG